MLGVAAWFAPVVAALVLAFASGGYFVKDWGLASILLLALLAAVVLAGNASFGGVAGLVALAAFGALAAWQGLSSLWADEPAASIEAMDRTLLYGAAFGLALVGVRRVGDLMGLLWAALIGSGVVAAAALGSRLLPDLIGGDVRPRLSYPLSYWNGMGALCAFGTMLAVGLAAQRRIPLPGRAAAAALAPMFLLALLLTYSRGAALVLLIGLAALIAIGPGRLEIVASTVAAVAVSAPLLIAANGEVAIAALDGRLPPHAHEGRVFLLLLLLTMAVSGAVGAGAAAGLRRLPATARLRVGLVVGACCAAALAAVIVVRMPAEGPVRWTQAQWDSFRSYDAAARADAQSVADRLAVSAGSGRWQNWGAAVDEFRERPVAGTGAGDYVFYWQQHRDIDLTVVNAHSVYLEVMGENGVIGLLLLLAPLGIAAWAYARHRRAGGDDDGLAGLALCAAGLVALHAAGDWDWQLPTIVLPAVALGAAALKISAGTATAPARAAARWVVAAAAVAAIVMVAGPALSERVLADARATAARGDLDRALVRARDAASFAPQEPEPRLLEANLLSDLGRPAEADAAFAAAVARSPHDWETFADWAYALARRGDDRAARVAALRAAALNPLEPRPHLILDGLSG